SRRGAWPVARSGRSRAPTVSQTTDPRQDGRDAVFHGRGGTRATGARGTDRRGDRPGSLTDRFSHPHHGARRVGRAHRPAGGRGERVLAAISRHWPTVPAELGAPGRCPARRRPLPPLLFTPAQRVSL